LFLLFLRVEQPRSVAYVPHRLVRTFGRARSIYFSFAVFGRSSCAVRRRYASSPSARAASQFGHVEHVPSFAAVRGLLFLLAVRDVDPRTVPFDLPTLARVRRASSAAAGQNGRPVGRICSSSTRFQASPPQCSSHVSRSSLWILILTQTLTDRVKRVDRRVFSSLVLSRSVLISGCGVCDREDFRKEACFLNVVLPSGDEIRVPHLSGSFGPNCARTQDWRSHPVGLLSAPFLAVIFDFTISRCFSSVKNRSGTVPECFGRAVCSSSIPLRVTFINGPLAVIAKVETADAVPMRDRMLDVVGTAVIARHLQRSFQRIVHHLESVPLTPDRDNMVVGRSSRRTI